MSDFDPHIINADRQARALETASHNITHAIDINTRDLQEQTETIKAQTEAIKDQTTAIKALLLHNILNNGSTMSDATADLQLLLNRARESN